ncbi:MULTISPECIES: hypothetical protein [Pseudophaeobacter]|jgi:hypothetical protein|uniref:hypothetical protein n=1 Tax=Pseudophaeobacter TaxID=1541822 RepID=UPI00242A73DA|nr:hypothetical protein [Pseudophaeobacter profundi]
MKHFLAPALIASCLLTPPLAAPAHAQDSADGSSLMERGVELFWEGLRQEMAPSLQELEGLMETIGPSMQGFLREMGPALAEIAGKVEDWSRYEVPEILPNGDIIIRRKPEPPQAEPDPPAEQEMAPLPEGSTDL